MTKRVLRHTTPEDLKQMLNSDAAKRIFNHTNKCTFCQELQGALGFLIEKHMEEEEKKEKLV